MCGRFSLEDPPKLVKEYFDVVNEVDITQNYNVAPGQYIPVIINQDDARKLLLMRWGFVPAWNHEPKPKLAPINAKVETVLHNKYFNKSIKERRCIVPMSGFFEWQATPYGKQPYYFSDANEVVFGAAGIWAERTVEDKKEYCVAIIVQEPTPEVKAVHDRMPLIINHDFYDKWFNENPEQTLDDLVKQTKKRKLQAWPVSMMMNKPSFNNPDCIKPIEL